MMKFKAPLIVYMLAVIWIIQMINMVTNYSLSVYGVQPRTASGLLGIFFMPFLHGSLWHAIGNSIPLLILGYLLSLHGRTLFLQVTIAVTLLCGLGTWLIGSSGLHVGASGLVLGYWSFLLAYGFFVRDLKSIGIAVVVAILYGGYVFALLDVRAHISWAGHAAGIVAGILVARYYASSKSNHQ